MTDKLTGAPVDDGQDSYEELDAYDESDCGYDPLAVEEEKNADEKAETFGYVGTPEEAEAKAPEEHQVPAAERINRLFEDMLPFKHWFLSIIDTCRDARGWEEVGQLVDGLQKKQRCVYSAQDFCTMLEGAGALKKVTADGEPYGEVKPELVEVVEDGRTYLRPTTPPEPFWRATEEGLEALRENDPVAELLQIMDEQQKYLSVFLEILDLCQGDGESINTIRERVNTNPVLEYPKKSAQFFMDYLEREDAIEWDGAWKITKIGEELLERLEERRAD